MEHIYLSIQNSTITAYGNLKTLVEGINMASKYSTIRRALVPNGTAVIEDIEIRKLFVVRGTRKSKTDNQNGKTRTDARPSAGNVF